MWENWNVLLDLILLIKNEEVLCEEDHGEGKHRIHITDEIMFEI